MAALRGRRQDRLDIASCLFQTSKQPVMIDAFLLFRALPDHAGETLERHQRLAGIGPLLQLLDGDMVAGRCGR
jgi:hypothetical protein